MTTVVTLSTYRFPHPKSGGPRRLHEISKVYKRAGWRVQSVVVRDPHANDGSYPADIEFELPESGRHRLFDGRMLPEIADVLTAAYVSSEDFAFPSLAGKLAEDTRLIHVEQPWLWPLACRIREYYRDRYIPILYSSANIESFLKAEIYSSLGLDFPDDLRSAIHELEAAAAHADGVAAVTCFDADALKALGARKVVIASNGVSEPAASDETLASWRTKLPKVPWALYVASGYRPNYSDFIEVFGNNLGCIPPDSRLFLAGSVGPLLKEILERGVWGPLNISRLQVLGELSDEDLGAVRILASAYILPILRGGGSSLKAAEAIYSGKPVVASPVALRGFKRFQSLPHIRPASDPVTFGKCLRDALRAGPVPLTQDQRRQLQSLKWENTLQPLVELAKELVER